MKFLLLVYIDPELVDTLPATEYDAEMRTCLEHADDLQREGRLIESQQLEVPSTAKSVRVRNGRQTVHDGPFAETREHLGGYYLIDVPDLDEALAIAKRVPVVDGGKVEVRPLMVR